MVITDLYPEAPYRMRGVLMLDPGGRERMLVVHKLGRSLLLIKH